MDAEQLARERSLLQIDAVYQLIPPELWSRRHDPSGVMETHRVFALWEHAKNRERRTIDRPECEGR